MPRAGQFYHRYGPLISAKSARCMHANLFDIDVPDNIIWPNGVLTEPNLCKIKPRLQIEPSPI
jgi:hypothetical protein